MKISRNYETKSANKLWFELRLDGWGVVEGWLVGWLVVKAEDVLEETTVVLAVEIEDETIVVDAVVIDVVTAVVTAEVDDVLTVDVDAVVIADEDDTMEEDADAGKTVVVDWHFISNKSDNIIISITLRFKLRFILRRKIFMDSANNLLN